VDMYGAAYEIKVRVKRIEISSYIRTNNLLKPFMIGLFYTVFVERQLGHSSYQNTNSWMAYQIYTLNINVQNLHRLNIYLYLEVLLIDSLHIIIYEKYCSLYI